ncbi:MAG: hypothetical protein H7308_14805 [Chthonomonadaceae bacterium]|nr:hypothetical protein [Chthonomonadaceae bacterium]
MKVYLLIVSTGKQSPGELHFRVRYIGKSLPKFTPILVSPSTERKTGRGSGNREDIASFRALTL